MDEQWRKIQGFGGVYEISNEARIRSWQKTGTMKSPPQNPKILKHRRNTKGDCFVRLGSKENRKTVLIRNLMRDTWMQGKENTTELVDPLDIKKKIESLEEKNNTLLKELDTQIKVSNATTLIEIA